MSKFLNTDLLNEWIPRLINETKSELVIIVPYIKTSDRIYNHLLEANKRGVETILIYRENKLSATERAKLEALDNLNLMYHPNVHAKCYYNEKYMIIGSMNLYEYSEKNNREMGVLFHREDLKGSDGHCMHDDAKLFEDAINETKAIINSSEFERKSRETNELGFEMDIIKNEKDKTEETCQRINKVFMHKRFEVVPHGDSWRCVCANYFDRIDVMMEGRVRIILKHDASRIEGLFNKTENIFIKHLPPYKEHYFEGYKYYWNRAQEPIYIYPDSRHQLWKGDKTEKETLELYRIGIDRVISFLRGYM